MKVEQVIEKLAEEKLIDNQRVYVYASVKGKLGGVVGAVNGLVLLSVYQDLLYIHKANLDNTCGERLAEIHIPEMNDIQGKAGLFGGKFSFSCEGKKYQFQLPAKAGQFVNFFVK